MKKMYHLTKEGIAELRVELDALIAKRPEVAEAIRSAREQGDLSENAEYQSARADQERNENRISELEAILLNSEVIKKPKAGKVQVGSTVTLKNGTVKKEFQIVGTVEADPLSGKVSDESPIGVALLGKAVGDTVEIVTPAETTTYKVASIS